VLRKLEGVVHVIRETAFAHRGAPPSLPLPHKGGGNSSKLPAQRRTVGARESR
jgi:hypothetical protein